MCFKLSLDLYNVIFDTQVFHFFWYASDGLFTFTKDAFLYSHTANYTLIFTLKLSCCLVFLSAIRGGVPRYRYDFLTKMG